MKKFVLILTIIFLLINSALYPAFAITLYPTITAPSGILIDADTGDVLFEKNAHMQMYPASTTKIMTAILTLENANLQDKVIIDKDTPFTDGSRIYVIEGEEFTVEQLLYALLIDSANDAAVALAKHISGSIEEFAKLMNKRAKEIGAKNTHFVNPNGLPNDKHVTTAYDLAIIARHAMTIPKFREIVKTVRYQIPPTNKQTETRYLKNSNRFLWGVGPRNKILYNGKSVDIKYNIIDGIKTGYTVLAQQCLVTSAKKDGHRLISVILKAKGKNIYLDSRTLIDYGFENFKFIKITDAGKKVKSIPIKNGTEKTIDLITQNNLYKTIPKNENLNSIDKIVKINKNISAPIQKGQLLGKVIFKSNEKNLGEVNLIAAKSIEQKKGITSIFYFDDKKRSLLHYFLIIFLIYIIWRTIVTIIRLRKRKNKLLRKRRLARKNKKYFY
ncbi:D-alanyl-D-alanine carboxypeptidase [Crassaminicella thermophila]|uniref:serine-type D-Ala-D-Ala carboxypeptidase n=1 Tax=Crassaminicella thermophila TaxID=2599308 RepID=A0A5C0SE89_CRATE|nr:D-alanyl-D-alanine carboxypeptidase family protein [Crassaminicella thermophila]QEK12047.1 D-alanyl-D-alanine carboxypeptidase [Crassaminicella thermophila]